jgi:hypothetical protein
MPYEGELLTQCGVINLLDFSEVSVVAVSGSGPNVCGHLILYTSSKGGYYFHVASVNSYPRYMTETGFRRYLKENGKRELRRRSLKLPNPDAAADTLESLLARTWLWGVLPHNCVAFCEAVISAGGGSWGSYSNCPTIATADTIEDRVNTFFSGLESSIYQLYGVPR